MQKHTPHGLLLLRPAAHRQTTFVFFPHAGGSPLSAGALAAALPSTVGVVAVDLASGGGSAGRPRRVSDAVEVVAQGFRHLLAQGGHNFPSRIVLVGNSYGALLAYETAWVLARHGVGVERLIVSGFRSPARASAEAPLHRLAPDRLRAELAARYGGLPIPIADEADVIQQSLAADLEACDTYRHAHEEALTMPIDVLHLLEDPSVSAGDLAAWSTLTLAPVSVRRLNTGHFPWATHPDDFARILLELTDADTGSDMARVNLAAMAAYSTAR